MKSTGSYTKKGILSVIALALCIITVMTGCIQHQDNNENHVNVPVNTPMAPAPVVTKTPLNYNLSSDYIDSDALISVVRSAADGKDTIDSSYCSYILNRYYISMTCDNNNDMIALFMGLYNAIATFKTEYTVPQGLNIKKPDMQDIMFAIYEDCPELFHVAPSYTYYTRSDVVISLEFEYTMTPAEYIQALESIYARFDEWLLDYTGSYEYELELYFYDRLLESCTYSDTAEYCRTPYGAIILGEALCEGYSQAFLMAMHYNGIFCLQVGGDAEDAETGKRESHAWNIVQINGNFYQVDPTWDDYDEAVASTSLYAYFNITDEQMYAHRTLDETYSRMTPPKCTSTECSYYTLWGSEIGETTDIRDFLFTAIEAHTQSLTDQGGVMVLKLKFRNSDQYNAFTDNLLMWLEEWNQTTEDCKITGYRLRSIASMGVIRVEMYSQLYDELMPEPTDIDDIYTPEPDADNPYDFEVDIDIDIDIDTKSADIFGGNAYIIPVP